MLPPPSASKPLEQEGLLSAVTVGTPGDQGPWMEPSAARASQRGLEPKSSGPLLRQVPHPSTRASARRKLFMSIALVSPPTSSSRLGFCWKEPPRGGGCGLPSASLSSAPRAGAGFYRPRAGCLWVSPSWETAAETRPRAQRFSLLGQSCFLGPERVRGPGVCAGVISEQTQGCCGRRRRWLPWVMGGDRLRDQG